MFRNGTMYHCPSGNYCPQRAQRPWECPAGTYSEVGQLPAFMDECDQCPEHFFCLRGTPDRFEYICDQRGEGGVYCPPGSSQPRLCEEGYWCRPNSAAPLSVADYEYVDTTGNPKLR